MLIPKARGELSATVFAALQTSDPLPDLDASIAESSEDSQIALWALYEQHYRGFDDVDPGREWDADLLRLRRTLEIEFEERLWDHAAPHLQDVAGDPVVLLEQLIERHDGVSVSQFVRRHADADQVRELFRHRSIYHLKESDPVAWVVPRLGTRPKAALMELQYDEYGDGDPNRLHHQLFSEALEAMGLRNEYGGYINEAPLEILELNNAMSLFGLHRRLRGAALGHLAAFEATSSLPSSKVAQGLRRLEFPDATAAYYDEHVAADAVHEQLALRTICGGLMSEEPALVRSVLFGAYTCLDLEDRYGRRMLEQWGAAA